MADLNGLSGPSYDQLVLVSAISFAAGDIT